MLSTFQKLVLATLAGAALLIAFVLAAKGPALAVGGSFALPGGLVATTVLPPYGGGPTPGILTHGTATVRVRPDTARLSVGVTAQAATASEAQSVVARRMALVIERAKALGIAERDTKTAGYSINPTYAHDGREGPRITGYQASQQLHLVLRKVDEAGKAVDTLVRADGATNVSVQFALDDPKMAAADARKQAIADARAKAQAMADAAGVRLGAVLSVSEAGGPMPMSRFEMLKDAAGAADAAQLPTGDLDIVINVQVQFAIGS